MSMGRLITRIFSVVAFGSGVGCLTWGISAAAMGEPIQIPLETSHAMAASAVIGIGAALLATGILTLILSFIGGRRPS